MADPAWSKNLACRYALCTGTGRSPTWPLQKSWSGPHREGEESKPMKHGQEKSDLFIIALKPTNKPGRLGAELVEPRERTEGNMAEQHTYWTLRRIKRVPEARLCTRSCSWDSSLTTRGGSPVRESRPPGSVRGASSNGCPYRDKPSKDHSSKENAPELDYSSFYGKTGWKTNCFELEVHRSS